MQDVAAIVVDIAVIDPKSKVLLTDAQIATVACAERNWLITLPGMPSGWLRTQWQNTLDANYDVAAAGGFRHPAVRTLYLPLSACPMITSLRNLLKRPVWRRQRILNVNASLSRPAIFGIRLYERYFYLSQQSF